MKIGILVGRENTFPPALIEKTEIVTEEYRFSAAVFPSEAWGAAAQHMHFDQGCLSGVNRDFPQKTMIDISRVDFDF